MKSKLQFVVATTTMARMFDVARHLKERGQLKALFTGYPSSKMAARGLTGPEIHCQAWPTLISLGMNRVIRSRSFINSTEPWPKIRFDRWMRDRLPECDVFFATSSNAMEAGREAKKKGALWVCDRPCTHILTQDRLLHEEYARLGRKWCGISQVIIDREIAEYNECDYILVASSFVKKSFVEHGVDPAKVWEIPHGVDVKKFKPTGEPEAGGFEVLFVGQKSLRKGLPTLIEAFRQIDHPKKHMTLVGTPAAETDALLSAAEGPDIKLTGSVPQASLAELMSKADVLVLPSIEDGFGMVVAQALACGCPVVVSDHAGASGIVKEGINGQVFPANDVAALVSALNWVKDHPDPKGLRKASYDSAQALGDWDVYVETIISNCEAALASRTPSRV